MPTAARLVAGIFFGLLAWFASELVIPLLPEGTNPGYFSQVNGVVGLLCGWVYMGNRVGEGYTSAIGVGLTTAALLTVATIFMHASIEMYHLSIKLFYDGPVEAIVGIFELAIRYGLLVVNPEVLSALIVGGCLGGWLCEWVGRRWS